MGYKILKNSILKVIIFSLLIGVIVTTACSGAQKVSAQAISSVSSELMCICGTCDLVLVDCTCDTAVKMKDTIRKKLAAGQTKEQIIQAMVQLYGQRVLPPEDRSS